jgi:5-methylcytosine-specific restriction endonuclease McrA
LNREVILEAKGGGKCELCGRFVRELTRHHLVPRSRHKKKRTKKAFERREMEKRVALLCRPCHRNVHAAIENKELEQKYNTLEALAAHPSIRRFTRWIGNKPHGAVPVPTGRPGSEPHAPAPQNPGVPLDREGPATLSARQ